MRRCYDWVPDACLAVKSGMPLPFLFAAQPSEPSAHAGNIDLCPGACPNHWYGQRVFLDGCSQRTIRLKAQDDRSRSDCDPGCCRRSTPSEAVW